MDRDSFTAMMEAIRALHAKHQFHAHGGEDIVYRVALMTEELGEISACASKGKPLEELAEEHADLMILMLGNAVAADFDLGEAFWKKMEVLATRESRIVDGRVRLFKPSEAPPADPPEKP